MWTDYWPIYERLEKEVCDYSFAVALNDQQKPVYSALLGELLIRCCSESENAGKSLLTILGSQSDPSDFNMPQIVTELHSRIQIEDKALQIIWPYQTLKDTSILPFARNGQGENPAWFKGYNNLKHDRGNHQDEGNLWNVVLALGGLFILNVWLRQDDIENDVEWRGSIARKMCSYSRFFAPNAFIVTKGGTMVRLVLT